MEIKLLEEGKDKLRLEVNDLTFVNILNENIWKQKGMDYSAYDVKHPYTSKPILVVRSSNPKKSVIDAADRIIEDVKELRRLVKKELK